MQGMFNGASDFNQSLGSWKLDSVANLANILSNTALSTYNYNDTLYRRGRLSEMTGAMKTGLTLDVAPAQYGGCESNASQGILGHGQLSKLPFPARKLMDGGMEPCAISGSVSYTPAREAGLTNAVTATLTLSAMGSVLSPGWMGQSMTFVKTYTGNVSGEVVQFTDVNEANMGSVVVDIDWIITTDIVAPIATSVVYTPAKEAGMTTGNVLVSVLFSEPVQALTGWVNLIGNLWAKNFAGNFSGELVFADLEGNAGMTGILIDWILPSVASAPKVEVSYEPEEATNGEVKAVIKISEDVQMVEED